MDYDIKIYETDEHNLYRFALGKLSKKTLFIFGINPSTANDKEPDPTMKQVMAFADKHGYTSFMMFNIYPLRETAPDLLPDRPDLQMVKKNTEIIWDIISKQPQADIWLAWGENIDKRNYLWSSWLEIYNKLKNHKNIHWFTLDKLLSCGHPRHPLYKSHSLNLQKLDIQGYLDKYNIK